MARKGTKGIRSYFSSNEGLQITPTSSASTASTSQIPMQEVITAQTNENSLSKEDDGSIGRGDDVEVDTEDLVEKDNSKSGKKRPRSTWDAGRNFLPQWAEIYTWIEPIPNPDGGLPKRCRCVPCSWKQKSNCEMQLKIDTIEKHVGKLYEKKVEDGKEVNVVTWKKKCRHKDNEILYEQHKETEKLNKENAVSICHMFSKILDKNLSAKAIQLQTVYHVLKLGRPMVYKRFLSLHSIPNFPDSHWSRNSSWEFANAINEVMKDDLKDIIKTCDYFALSLDEASAKDHSSWVCMTVYHVKDHVRRANYVSVTRLLHDANAENIFEIVKENLTAHLGLSMVDIGRKLVCVGVDGASVMQGNRTGICVRMQTGMAPYMLGIHCLAHRMDLTFEIVDKFKCVEKVEKLVDSAYAFFSRSSKRYRLFKEMSVGLTKGSKMLKNVSTRWISLCYPAQRLFNEYPALVALVDKLCVNNSKETEKALELLTSLTDIETLLTLAGMLPMLKQMNMLVKMAEKRTMYIVEYNTARKNICQALDGLYTISPEVPYDRENFQLWYKLIEIEGTNSKSFLAYDSKDTVCVKVHSRLVQMYFRKNRVRGCLPGRVPTTRNAFNDTIVLVRRNLAEVAKALSAEIRQCFPREDLLDAMSIVYPQFWLHNKPVEKVQSEFKRRLSILIEHFAHASTLEGGEIIQGAISEEALLAQSTCFGSTMWNQVEKLKKPTEIGAIMRLWTRLSYSEVLKEHMSEYFKLADLCQTMILGSVEDERTFSIMNVLKNKGRNKLTKNLDLCLRAYASEYSIDEFPYERALAAWSSMCCRRGQEKEAASNVEVFESAAGWQA